MINWALASELDRVDHHRARRSGWPGCGGPTTPSCSSSTTSREFTTNTGGSKLRMTKPFVEYDSQRHRLLGLLDGAPIFAVEALTEGEVHEPARGRRPADRQRARHRRGRDGDHPLAPDGAAAARGAADRPRSSTAASPGTATSASDDHFPRTDPAVIVAVIDDDGPAAAGRAGGLGQPGLGAGRLRRGGRVAGAGHPPRDRRGGRHQPRPRSHYFGSQPWPFPRSLMVGFFARATTHRASASTPTRSPTPTGTPATS